MMIQLISYQYILFSMALLCILHILDGNMHILLLKILEYFVQFQSSKLMIKIQQVIEDIVYYRWKALS